MGNNQGTQQGMHPVVCDIWESHRNLNSPREPPKEDSDISKCVNAVVPKKIKVENEPQIFQKPIKKELEEEVDLNEKYRMRNAMAEIETFKEKLAAADAKEKELSRRLQEYEMKSRVKTEFTAELCEKANAFENMKGMFEGACREAKSAELRAAEAEMRFAELVKQNESSDRERMAKNREQENRISCLMEELNITRKNMEIVQRTNAEVPRLREKLIAMSKENQEMKMEIHSLKEQAIVLERKLAEAQEERRREEYPEEYMAHLDRANTEMGEELRRLERENDMMRSTDLGKMFDDVKELKKQNEKMEKELVRRVQSNGDVNEEIRDENRALKQQLVQIQEHERTLAKSMSSMMVTLKKNEQERRRLEHQKRSLKERITWLEANLNARSVSFNETPWTMPSAEPIAPSPSNSSLPSSHLTPPPCHLPLHPNPLFVPPGTVFPKPATPAPSRAVLRAYEQGLLLPGVPKEREPGVSGHSGNPMVEVPYSHSVCSVEQSNSSAAVSPFFSSTPFRNPEDISRAVEEPSSKKLKRESFVRRLTASDRDFE